LDPKSAAVDSDSSVDLETTLERIDRDLTALGESVLQNARERKSLLSKNGELQQTIADLETRLKIAQTEKTSAENCNKQYDTERKQLNEAVATLRSALEDMKTRLIAADKEKKQLKSENDRLKAQLGTAKPL
jgi:chromosome segregation ATPase